jgi:hypothetical protein
MHHMAIAAFVVTQELELRGCGAPADVTPHPEEEYETPQIVAHPVKVLEAYLAECCVCGFSLRLADGLIGV